MNKRGKYHTYFIWLSHIVTQFRSSFANVNNPLGVNGKLTDILGVRETARCGQYIGTHIASPGFIFTSRKGCNNSFLDGVQNKTATKNGA